VPLDEAWGRGPGTVAPGLTRDGAAAVRAALATLTPPTEEAGRALADAQTSLTRNAARMD
jgi:hypothetical protein